MTASRFGWTFALTSLAWFVFALDRLVVTTALPVISADLGADLAGTEWAVSAYTLHLRRAPADRRRARATASAVAACSPRGWRCSRWARSRRPRPDGRRVGRGASVQGAGGAVFAPLAMTC